MFLNIIPHFGMFWNTVPNFWIPCNNVLHLRTFKITFHIFSHYETLIRHFSYLELTLQIFQFLENTFHIFAYLAIFDFKPISDSETLRLIIFCFHNVQSQLIQLSKLFTVGKHQKSNCNCHCCEWVLTWSKLLKNVCRRKQPEGTVATINSSLSLCK